MLVKVYTPELKPAVLYLMSTHDMPKLGFELPKLGLVVMTDEGGSVPVCAGFLRAVEGGSYIMDSLVSNKKLKTEQRHQGMELLWPALLSLAGSHSVLGFSTDGGTQARAIAHGFTALPHTVYSLTR